MSDNILILGNGFDIAMGRKTSYEDFLMFSDYIYICLNYPIRYPKYDSEEVERVNLNKLERGDISEIETDLKRKVSDFSSTQEYESLIFETLKEFNFDELLQIFSTDLIKMLKEYQVVCKQQTAIGISPDYLEEFIVFGHSVNPLDKEIFRKCFELAEYNRVLYQFIFVYHNEQSKRSIVKNLAIILGKNKIIELTGKNKIKFVKSDNLDKMIKNLY